MTVFCLTKSNLFLTEPSYYMLYNNVHNEFSNYRTFMDNNEHNINITEVLIHSPQCIWTSQCFHDNPVIYGSLLWLMTHISHHSCTGMCLLWGFISSVSLTMKGILLSSLVLYNVLQFRGSIFRHNPSIIESPQEWVGSGVQLLLDRPLTEIIP